MVVLGLAIIRLVIDPVITWQVALTIGPKQRQQINSFDNGMVLAQQHVGDKIDLSRVLLVQDSVMQHQYPGVQPNLKPSPPQQCVVGWLKPVQQKGIRIMRGLNRTNRFGPLSIHRRRIHRCGDKEVDEVLSGDFSLVHSYQR